MKILHSIHHHTKNVTLAIIITLFSLSVLMTPLGSQAQPKEHFVVLVSDYEKVHMYFDPKLVVVDVGDTVTWINKQAETHTITLYPDGYPEGAENFRSPEFNESGQSWSYTFNTPGTYEYHCEPHVLLGMHGSVIVGEPSGPRDFHVPTAEELRIYRSRMLELFDESDVGYVEEEEEEETQ